LNELIAEGHKVPKELNAVEIEAKDRKEAIEILVSVFNQKSNPFAEEYLIEFLEVEQISIEEVNIESVNVVSETIEEETVLDAIEDDFDSTPPTEAITVLGDLYEIGEHRLLCGDSTDSDSVALLMNGSKADMVFTDPPYSITTQGGGVLQKHFTKTAERIKDIVDFKPQEWLQTLPLYFNGNMNTFIFCNKDLIPDYLNFAKENNYNFNILVWCKKQVVPFTGGHHYSDIEYIIYLSKKPIFNNGIKNVEYRKYFVLDNEKSKDHPTIKPLEIILNEIQIASNKNGIVAECFTGSGSTMVASHQLKRKCYGMELDPKYCDVIVKRMIKLDPTLNIKRNGVVIDKKEFE
jgi:DNA modification methylase